MFLLLANVGALFGLWPYLHQRWHGMMILAVCISFIGWAVSAVPSAEAFRIGMSAGAQHQRAQCADQCGHMCDEHPRLAVIAAAAGAENVAHLPSRKTQRR